MSAFFLPQVWLEITQRMFTALKELEDKSPPNTNQVGAVLSQGHVRTVCVELGGGGGGDCDAPYRHLRVAMHVVGCNCRFQPRVPPDARCFQCLCLPPWR